MRSAKQSLLNKKIPTLIAALVLVCAIFSLTWLRQNTVLFGTKAAVGNSPKSVQISNVTDISFTVSYITDERNLGTVTYGKDITLGSISLDDRDRQSATASAYRIHHITVQNLEPATKYYFSIFSGDELFNNNDQPYEVVTSGRIKDTPTSQAPVAGKVTLEDNTIPAEAVAYVSAQDSQLLSSLVKPDGSYMIPLNTIRKTDISAPLTLAPDTILQLVITSPISQSKASLLASQVNPVPLVILSKDYNFAVSNEPITQTRIASGSATASGSGELSSRLIGAFPAVVDTTVASGPAILVPFENQRFKDLQPRFKGKAIPATEVDITIDALQPINITILSDDYGNWEYRPEEPLNPGNHTITIRSADSTGFLESVSQSFIINASGSQFADPTVTPPQFNIPSATPAARPTDIPVTIPAIPSPTMQPTMQPTIITTPTVFATPTVNLTPVARPSLPPSGNSTLVIGSIAILTIIGIGSLLFLL